KEHPCLPCSSSAFNLYSLSLTRYNQEEPGFHFTYSHSERRTSLRATIRLISPSPLRDAKRFISQTGRPVAAPHTKTRDNFKDKKTTKGFQHVHRSEGMEGSIQP